MGGSERGKEFKNKCQRVVVIFEKNVKDKST